MVRIFSALAVAALVIAAIPSPVAAASASQGSAYRYRAAEAGSQNSVRLARRAERYHRWCTRSVKPYRNNVTFALREARGCFRG